MKARAVLLACVAAVCCPAFGVAQGVMDFAGALPYIKVEPTLFTGYLFQNKGVSMTIGGKPGGSGGSPSVRQDYDLRGLWIEAMVPVKSTGIMGLAFGASYLVPFNVTSTESYGVDAGGGLIQRNWHTATQWFNLQAATTFDVAPAVTAIAGFRYESFMTNFKNPQNIVGAVGGPSDIGDMTFAGYIPFIGIALHNSGYLGPSVKLDVGAVGTPIVFGSLQYREKFGLFSASPTNTPAPGTNYTPLYPGAPVYGTTVYGLPAYNEFKKGHFLEAFVNCSIVMETVTLGVFARFTSVFCSTNVDLGERNEVAYAIYIPDSTKLASAVYAPYPDTDLAFEFQRRSWVIGGKVSMDF
jgi:hypothetical protein